MFGFRDRCGYVVKNYVLLQGDRVLPFGIFCALMAAGPHVIWIPFEAWTPWSHLAVFFYCFAMWWISDEQCETRHGRVSLDGRASEPPTVRGRLILGAVLTAVLVAGGLLGFSVGAVELVAAAWMFGYRLQGGELWRLYIVVGTAIGCVGVYDALSALYSEPVIGGSWVMIVAGAVITFRAISDQSTFQESSNLMRKEGGYGV